MSTVYIDRRDSVLRLDANTIGIYENDKKVGSVPLLPIKRLIVIGNNLIESALIKRLIDNNCLIVLLSGRSMRFVGIIYGKKQNDAKRRLLQCKKVGSEDQILIINEIVQKKLRGYVQNIKELIDKKGYYESYFLDKIDTIQRAVNKTAGIVLDIDSLLGVEGSAAAAYFDIFTNFFEPELAFSSRNRQPPLDPVNAMLSLFYTFLHYEIVRELYISGLDPFIGYLHSIQSGRESLACDFVEIFRPAVDMLVFNLFEEGVVTKKDFYNDEDGGCYLRKEKRQEIFKINEEFQSRMRNLYRKEITQFIRRIGDEEGPIFE